MAGTGSFQYEVEKSGESRADQVATVRCHGRLVSENSAEVKEVVRALLPQGGRIVIDLSDVSYLDSSGLGTLVGLKVSAIKLHYLLDERSDDVSNFVCPDSYLPSCGSTSVMPPCPFQTPVCMSIRT